MGGIVMDSKNVARQNLQTFGRNLSAMVMPNIGAFIAWGLITALFIDTGWTPNEKLASMVSPMITYLLPLLIGYTGGKNIHGVRGGVMGSIATMGVIVGTDIPMFIGAMIVGPLSAFLLKKLDKSLINIIPSGFEMLVSNFSLGILGTVSAISSYLAIGPLVSNASHVLGIAVTYIVSAGLLPLVSIFVEPAKILFLNNAINHGVLTPLGIAQAQEIGKSIFYLIETNPGPGLGILLAYALFAKGSIKQSAPSAVIIHFFGGIHEIYFPYVLMNPLLLIAVISGGASGILIFTIFDAGLIASPSPGSILALMIMTPKGGHLSIITGVAVSTVVSFLVASVLVKNQSYSIVDEDFEKAKNDVADMKVSSKGNINLPKIGEVKSIIYACDAGMGSSAMGASMLSKKLKKLGYNILVKNFPINSIPEDATIVVTHEQLTERAIKNAKNSYHISVTDFLDMSISEKVIPFLTKDSYSNDNSSFEKSDLKVSILKKTDIKQNQKSVSKLDAIREAGNLLVSGGYVEFGYIQSMLDRENDISTYIGKGVAIPHGLSSGKTLIKKSGVVIVQYPDGIDFGDEKAYLIIGIAGLGDDHLQIISKLSDIIDDGEIERIQEIASSNDLDYVYNLFK
jgi:mannitol PTS system EIICBA or EIICB component